MALMIMGSSGGRCGRKGSAVPDIITTGVGGATRGGSNVRAKTSMVDAVGGRVLQRVTNEPFLSNDTSATDIVTHQMSLLSFDLHIV